MTRYGFPYQGSKAGIAEYIIDALPKGKRLVDLFGGGGAITHCACLSGKWNFVLYNDYDPLPVQLMKRAINGEFNANKFIPKFITRDEFIAKKDTDAYIKYIWSFGNNGCSYLFGKGKEEIKHIAHDFVVFGQKSPVLDKLCTGYDKVVTATDYPTRRKQFCPFVEKKIKGLNRGLQQLQRLQQLERLEQLQQLQQLDGGGV